MAKQFTDVSSKYGAPMGRDSYGDSAKSFRVRLFEVRLDAGGYGDGGAYWGHSPWFSGGKQIQLFCADATDGARDFVRATSRREAMEKLGLRPDQLISKAGL